MSEVLDIAEEVVTFLATYHAELLFSPEFNLGELDTMRVVVVPTGTEYKTLSRASHEEVLKISVGILKRATEEDLPQLLEFVEELGLGFLSKKLAGATCIAVLYDPIYSPSHLRERNQFTSVIQLVFKKIK